MASWINKTISHNIQSMAGKRIDKKYLIIESDDWGSIRMPSRGVYEKLINQGLPIENDRFNKYDNLASKEDLEMLFNALSNFKDIKNNHPVFTINVTTSNPDFKSIQESNFSNYFLEPFFKTIQDQKPGAIETWRKGISQNFFSPQYHGRDHVHTQRWLTALRSGEKNIIKAFNEGVYGIVPPYDSPEYFMAAYDYFEDDSIKEQLESIKQGIEIFEFFFGFKPISFIPPCYVANKSLLNCLKNFDILALQGKIIHLVPQKTPNNNRQYKKLYRVSGAKMKNGLINLVRNAFFEPSLNPSKDPTDDVLKRIGIAFNWRKPAIVSSHRVNYIGSLDMQNRENSLRQLSSLLSKVLKKWPDVEFISSDTLVKIYQKSHA